MREQLAGILSDGEWHDVYFLAFQVDRAYPLVAQLLAVWWRAGLIEVRKAKCRDGVDCWCGGTTHPKVQGPKGGIALARR